MTTEMVATFMGTLAICAVTGVTIAKYLQKNKQKPVDTGINVPEAKIDRQGFKEELIPEDLDAIIIGSGMGGLTCAALLAKSGKKVLVLEQHYIAGGNCHTFTEHGYEFDTGLHYVGSKMGTKGEPAPGARLMEFITDNGVEWDRMDDFHDIAVFGSGSEKESFPMHQDSKKQIADLKAWFPEDKDAIDKYYGLVRASVDQIPILMGSMLLPRFVSDMLRPLARHFLSLFRVTTLELLLTLTTNKKLIGVLTYLWGDQGDTPGTSAFATHGVLVDHWFGGSWYPKGGPSVIARRMIRVIEKGGGKVLVRAPVSEILIDERGAAEGVQVKDLQIFARAVISSVGAPTTFKKLVPPSYSHLVQEHLHGLQQPGLQSNTSITILFVGLKDEKGELRLPTHNVWRCPSFDHEANLAAFRADPSAPFPALFTSFPSAKDSTYKHRHPGKQVAIVAAPTVFEHVEAFKNERCMHRSKQYQAIKEDMKERLLQELLQDFPQLRDHIDYVDLGTPVTNDVYLGTHRGAIFGMPHTPERFQAAWLRPQTPIKRLYLTGQDTLVAGISAAMLSGFVTASSVDKSVLFKVLPLLGKT